jgi:hypothetical protein
MGAGRTNDSADSRRRAQAAAAEGVAGVASEAAPAPLALRARSNRGMTTTFHELLET